MRACIGMVSSRIDSIRPGHLASLIELIPRSERARLMDLVKFRGVVDGSRRSRVGGEFSSFMKGRDRVAIIV